MAEDEVDGHRGGGLCHYAPRYAQIRGGAYIAAILAVQTRDKSGSVPPDYSECLRERDVPVIEQGEIAPRAPAHPRMHANNIGRANTRKPCPYLLRAPAPGAEEGILLIMVTLDAHEGGWLGRKTTQNDTRTDFPSWAVAQLRRLHDHVARQREREEQPSCAITSGGGSNVDMDEDPPGLDEELHAAHLLSEAGAAQDPPTTTLTAMAATTDTARRGTCRTARLPPRRRVPSPPRAPLPGRHGAPGQPLAQPGMPARPPSKPHRLAGGQAAEQSRRPRLRVVSGSPQPGSPT